MTRPTDELVGSADTLAVDKMLVSILLLSNLRERKVSRNVVIEATAFAVVARFPVDVVNVPERPPASGRSTK